jgi:hypothetical protein
MNKIKVKRTFGKDYKEMKINTTPILNFINKNKRLDKLFQTYMSDIKYAMKIHRERVDEFKTLWGKQDFCFNYEYYTYNWVVEHNGCEAIIYSGKNRGTGIEIILDEKGNSKGDVGDFYAEFIKIMMNFK